MEDLQGYKFPDQILCDTLNEYAITNVAQKGYNFIVFAVNYAVAHEMTMHKIYDVIAYAYNLTYKNVERQIRHTLDGGTLKGVKNREALAQIAYRYLYKKQGE